MGHFILVVYREQHLCLCTNTCPSVNQGQTSETYIMVYVDKNTLQLENVLWQAIKNGLPLSISKKFGTTNDQF